MCSGKILWPLCLLVLTSLLSLSSLAAPAHRGIWRRLVLADGQQVEAQLCGDERCCFWATADGRLFVNGADGTVRPVTLSDVAEQSHQWEQSRTLRKPQTHVQTPGLHKAGQRDGESAFLGHKKGLIILAEFQDKKFVTPDCRTFFDRVANERGFHEGRYEGSVKDYFLDQSHGLFELDFDVVGPVTVSQGYAYYGGPGLGSVDAAPWQMVEEACRLVDSEVSFADYDWDGDGAVDQVFVLYAGEGESTSGDNNAIWPHEYEFMSVVSGGIHLYPDGIHLDGVLLNTYACANEVRGTGEFEGIGTICHEFAHCMGLPDTYDTYYYGFYGMGVWDVMSYGEYNGQGFLPAGFSSYEKMACGWLQPVELTADTVVSNMQPLAQGGEAYLIRNEAYPDEYYMLENRQLTGWDRGQPAAGMLVLHVDYDADVWHENIVNTVVDMRGSNPIYDKLYNTHQRLTVVHADNDDDHSYWKSDWQSWTQNTHEGDVYPYQGNDSLTDNSRPVAEVYHPNTDGTYYLNRAVRRIRQNADLSMGFDFSHISRVFIYEDSTLVEQPELRGAVFHESFHDCLGTGGNDGVFKGSSEVASAPFVPDHAGWESAVMSGGARCAKFGNGANVGVVTSPVLTLDGRPMVLEFNAAPWSRDDTDLSLRVTGNASLGQTQFEMEEGAWIRFSTTLQGTGDVRLTFEPGKRFFLDEVVARDPAVVPEGIHDVHPDRPRGLWGHSLLGQPVGRDHKGLIVRNHAVTLCR